MEGVQPSLRSVEPGSRLPAVVPDAERITHAPELAAAELTQWLDAAGAAPRGPVVVLSGAGLSTDSGIPDYRGPSGTRRHHKPMTYQEFVGAPQARHRYWARSYLGWRQIADARPNAGHHAVAQLQAEGRVGPVITQNVDGLHHAAGTADVVELHGGLDRVVCLHCGERTDRAEIDRRLRAANPHFGARVDGVNPDGDVDLPDDQLDGFVMVGCEICRVGPLKPDVVFFGENVPRDRVDTCFAHVDAAGGLLVLGSSLTVMSGYRFVLRASKLGIPVAIVNQGPTRGDAHATLRLDAPLGGVLAHAAAGRPTHLAAPANR